MTNKQTVIVGMSGGVDSSVSALLLKEQGFHVIGLFMKNWEEKDEEGICRSASDFDDVRRVCDQIDIPFYGINFVENYRESVFNLFIEDLKKGFTPNPDILCNKMIKFGVFLNKAKELGGDFLATGHYCQIGLPLEYPVLLKGKDPNKDQSYFLYTLSSDILQKVLFPVGNLEKNKVREIARSFNLHTSEKKDSTGICFIGKRNFRQFISGHIAFQPGFFKRLDGTIIGQHLGIAYYTLGQRKGLGIGGKGDAWFVVGKDVNTGTIYIEQGSDHPALYSDTLTAHTLTWINQAPTKFPFTCHCKIRYRQVDHPCVIESITGKEASITFPIPQRAVTPGQSIVFYQGEVCLGGGVIQEAGASYAQQGKLLPSSY